MGTRLAVCLGWGGLHLELGHMLVDAAALLRTETINR